ncbi:hypothetical protein BU16DRAFT_556831 [Lophium mytilinum]|uniref:Uncharacterized protein n=1 Tax=Lophium mytilinum TaxID=390894 RepID=A0A6A6R740_9PEZI|nr:hypothetical protein BU16DRAFT_556831 [Lophium mytilinum]
MAGHVHGGKGVEGWLVCAAAGATHWHTSGTGGRHQGRRHCTVPERRPKIRLDSAVAGGVRVIWLAAGHKLVVPDGGGQLSSLPQRLVALSRLRTDLLQRIPPLPPSSQPLLLHFLLAHHRIQRPAVLGRPRPLPASRRPGLQHRRPLDVVAGSPLRRTARQTLLRPVIVPDLREARTSRQLGVLHVSRHRRRAHRL